MIFFIVNKMIFFPQRIFRTQHLLQEPLSTKGLFGQPHADLVQLPRLLWVNDDLKEKSHSADLRQVSVLIFVLIISQNVL